MVGAVCLLLSSTVYAEDLKSTDANIVGHVIEKSTREHLPYMTVSLKGTTIGTMTDATGHYFLKNLPEGEFTLSVSAVGYKSQERKVVLKRGKTLEENFELEEDMVALDGVVVTANRNETARRLAPTLVKVVTPKLFEQTNSHTLSQGLAFQPGVRVETDCQNCGYSQVRINGLDGKYTQILIDSRPIFSSLAGVYGLEQIPANMIERVEVVRGFGSKQGLMETILEENSHILEERLEKAVEEPGDVPQVLYRVARAYFDFAGSHWQFYLFMLSQFYSGKKSEGFRAVYPLIQKYYQLVVRIFEDSADRLGNMGGRQEQFAVSFMGILDSHMMMLGREQDEEHGLVMTDQRTYEIVRQFLYGIYS